MLAKLLNIVASKRFFYCIVGLLVVQAAWIALSGGYPMAFDEDFHLGIIRLYAHHLSPFWAHQPAGADIYGPVYRDPSYLYHYLMSFPYRLMNVFTHDQTVQVIILRFINIGLLASSLLLYRRLLLKARVSRTLVHVVLALFVFIPIVPFLAAQISYDNLILPLTAVVLLLTSAINDELERDKRINSAKFVLLITVGLLASLVKYTFLPIFLAVLVFLGVQFYRYLGRKKKFWRSFWLGVGLLSRRSRWLLAIGLIISSGLFVERYGINLIRYHEVVPDCGQILSVKRCNAYGPWIRDYTFAAIKGPGLHGPLGFSADWLYGMWLRTFFTLGGAGTTFETRGPLPLPSVAAIVLVVAGFGLFVWKAKHIFRRYPTSTLWLFCSVSLFYIGVLWLDEYKGYLHAGQPVAINGRYLLPVYLLVMLLLSLGFAELLHKRLKLQAAVVAVSLLCFIWGGGVLTFILRSHDSWYWPNRTALHANQGAQHVLYRLVPGAYSPTLFLR